MFSNAHAARSKARFYVFPKSMFFGIPLREGVRRQFCCMLIGILAMTLTQLKPNPPCFNLVHLGNIRHRSCLRVEFLRRARGVSLPPRNCVWRMSQIGRLQPDIRSI